MGADASAQIQKVDLIDVDSSEYTLGDGSLMLIRASSDQILADVNSSQSQATVVNMWATWCAPCIEEFPEFISLSQAYDTSSVRIIFVSVDFDEQWDAAQRFLKSVGWNSLSYFKAEKDNEFVAAFSDMWSGAVPATFVFSKNDGLVWSVEGKTTFGELDRILGQITN